MRFLKVETPRGRRFYVDGRRVSCGAYNVAWARCNRDGRVDSFVTRIKGDVTRHYCSGRAPA